MSIARFSRFFLLGSVFLLPNTALAAKFVIIENDSPSPTASGDELDDRSLLDEDEFDQPITARQRYERAGDTARKRRLRSEDDWEEDDTPQPITREELEKILDEKLAKKAAEEAAPAPTPTPEPTPEPTPPPLDETNNPAFGKVGGIAPVGLGTMGGDGSNTGK